MKKHQHTYDENGKMTCCSLEEKIDRNTPPPLLNQQNNVNLKRIKIQNKHEKQDDYVGHDHSEESYRSGGHYHETLQHEREGDCCEISTNKSEPEHDHANYGYWPVVISFLLLLLGLLFEHFLGLSWFSGWVKIIWYVLAYIPVGVPVIREAAEAIRKGEIFTEFFLMSLATIGAFAIGEYPEGVAVMLFYTVGELFQMNAVQRAKNNITALLDVRPKIANVFRNNSYDEVKPEEVEIGETIQVKVGEKIPLDGVLKSEKASLNTAAITGESKPQTALNGEDVLAGSINLEEVIEVETTKQFEDSSVSKILHLVQNATSKKAKTELLIRRLARIYTPIVFFMAIGICFLPVLFVENYIFQDWLYRALVFLVISCPCALVISIPLGYFGGLGAASKNGILFKGATYMDILTRVNTLVMDKTGTVTKGTFRIKKIHTDKNFSERDLMKYLMSLEAKSTHPIAKAILEYQNDEKLFETTDVEEIAGKGLKGNVNGKTILAGNVKLMKQFGISVSEEIKDIVDTIVLVGIDEKFAGYVTISDEIKSDAKDIVKQLKSMNLDEIIMLSGDKDSITKKVASEIGINDAEGSLLPEDKLKKVEEIKTNPEKIVAFIGDGINDAPVLATSDLGVAMGAMGSDVAIETADMVIQTDEPSKFFTGWKISKTTNRIIWQNIGLAFFVKALVLILGALGMANMWQAVFADVGVALLAILNAIRLQKMKW